MKVDPAQAKFVRDLAYHYASWIADDKPADVDIVIIVKRKEIVAAMSNLERDRERYAKLLEATATAIRTAPLDGEPITITL